MYYSLKVTCTTLFVSVFPFAWIQQFTAVLVLYAIKY